MSHGKQVTLYTHDRGPNGWKVAIVLEELGLTYESKFLDFNTGEHKAPDFVKLNPNGRIPAIIDHKNNDFIIWESNAIIQYLVDRYDIAHKVSVAPGTDEYYTQLQWLYFQASGQGPYFGQIAWFIMMHPEKVPSVIERYRNEVRRVLGVLESVLSKQEWLVAGKPTVADFTFLPWNDIAEARLFESFDFAKEFPATAKWHKKLLERPAVAKVFDDKTKALAAAH
ncbi:glutathione S-transferase [Phanerochaete sordida]|uniref:glutathione transferase n=1 Tax=Phanerochaete sordida TaxID=48140 RepID=A0A9P3GAV6_9APHY|nr:glutathione S-transferase [Phanerochaete sordida]